MLRFSTYYGREIWINPDRVISVTDGGCGSRGVCAFVAFDNGTMETLSGSAEEVWTRLQTKEAVSPDA